MSSRKSGFSDRLIEAIAQKRSYVVVGLDPHLELMPDVLQPEIQGREREKIAEVVADFCLAIVAGVRDIAVCLKPQVAFFERLGPQGLVSLERIVKEARGQGLLVLMDAKRGDIGSTAQAYAEYFLSDTLGGLDADAVTVNPYFGRDGLRAFVRYCQGGKGVFLLAKTSNQSSADLQDQVVDAKSGKRVYGLVADMARELGRGVQAQAAHGFGSVGIVVGASHRDQAEELRAEYGDLWFLVPGYGAQGGGAEDVVGSFDSEGLGAVVNASRSIMFAFRGEGKGQARNQADWVAAARKEAERMRADINAALIASGRRLAF